MSESRKQVSCPGDRGFRMACLGVGAIHVLCGSMILLGGVRGSLEQFKIPDEVLGSAFYQDAIRWVYVHQVNLGLTIALVGWFAQRPALKRYFSRLMLLIHALFTFLDFRSSDSIVGNGLYKGSASLGPAVIALLCTLVFFYLTVVTSRPATGTSP